MMERILFEGKGCRGNLHMHTTRSDGAKTPEEALAIYRGQGYDFVALTDHYRFSPQGEHEGMLVLSGAEYDSFSQDGLEVFHIVCIGAERDPQVTREDSAQDTVRKIRESGGIAILAHPHWSMQTVGSILPIEGLEAMEIYNSVSGLPMNCRPDSSQFSDLLSARGKFLGAVASDDSHPYTFEACMSRTVVDVKERSREAVLEALRQRRFYATQGPELTFAGIRSGRLELSCSPVSTAVFFTNLPWSPKRSVCGEGLTEFSYELGPGETFVRVQLIDSRGKSAWLNPVPASYFS